MRGYNSQYEKKCQLRAGANLRIALVSGRDLFYPHRVKSHLEGVRWSDNHCFREQMPSIAFCLGMKAPKSWYVFVMQSDLHSKGPSCVREHFRGWRKVLFANIVAQAQGHVDVLYLCTAKDVRRACFPGTFKHSRKQTWGNIYDLTAKEWGMPLVKVERAVNVSIYRHTPSIFSRYFYELPLRTRLQRVGYDGMQ
jgi:hypothetical protein